jgi:hypothetical protein
MRGAGLVLDLLRRLAYLSTTDARVRMLNPELVVR